MSVCLGTDLKGVEEILGIKRIRSVDFRIAFDEVVSCKVEFLMDQVQAQAMLNLFKDGKWRSPPQHEAIDTTTFESAHYKTAVPSFAHYTNLSEAEILRMEEERRRV